LGQDKWEQHIAHIAQQVDVTPTTVHEMVIQASVAGGGVQGRFEGHDRAEDLDHGQFVPRTAVEMAREGLSTTFAARRRDPGPGADPEQVPAGSTEPRAVDRGR
jgi:hypothetical protein